MSFLRRCFRNYAILSFALAVLTGVTNKSGIVILAAFSIGILIGFVRCVILVGMRRILPRS